MAFGTAGEDPREPSAGGSRDNLRSSYREKLLEHLFAGAVMRHFWLNRSERLEMLRSEVDDGGYDLVLETDAVVRHIQLKASHAGAATPGVKINAGLARKPSGCVIWLRFDPTTLGLGPYLWFGGKPCEKLPDLASFKTATHTKRNAQGVKGERLNIRYLPKAAFEPLPSIEDVVARLFGDGRQTIPDSCRQGRQG